MTESRSSERSEVEGLRMTERMRLVIVRRASAEFAEATAANLVAVNAFPVRVKVISSYYDKVDHCCHGSDQTQKHSDVDQQAKS